MTSQYLATNLEALTQVAPAIRQMLAAAAPALMAVPDAASEAGQLSYHLRAAEKHAHALLRKLEANPGASAVQPARQLDDGHGGEA